MFCLSQSRFLQFAVISVLFLSLIACKQNQSSSELVDPAKPLEFTPRVQTENIDGSEAILVKFKSSTGSSSRARSLSAAGLVESASFTLVPGLTRAEPLPGFTVTQTLESLASDTSVAYAEPDYLLTTNVVPDDTDFSQQYGLNNTGQSNGSAGADISALNAWDIQIGTDVVIAVIDSGVDYTHPDLRDNIWANTAEIPNNGIDDDQNGRVDDVRGWDFSNNDNDPMDDNNHGTHVAGVIGAKGNNTSGITGINWNVKIMPLKFMNARGSGRTSAAIRALEYAVRNGAKISNNSWGGGPFSQALFDAIQSANHSGHLFVAAAGNDGTDNDRSAHYPSSFNLPNIISVAATDRNDRLASFSNFGARSVDLAAPGVNILSTIRNNAYREMSGTSMAAPFVAGVAGLLVAQNPELSVTQIKDTLLNNVDNNQSVAGRTVSGGRLNAEAALVALSSITSPQPSVPVADPVNDPLPITDPTPVTDPVLVTDPVPITNPTPVTDPVVTPPITTPVETTPVVTPEPVVTEVVITPTLTYLLLGSSAQMIASGGTAPYTWSIDDPTIAEIDSNTGMITGLALGSAIVTATDSLAASSTAYEITVLTMGISPGNLTEIKLSETVTFSADGGIAPYDWQLSDSGLVDMVVDGVDNRNITLSPNQTGSIKITLIDSVGNVAASNIIDIIIPQMVLTPGNADLYVNNSIQLGVSGGTSPYIWNSSNPTVATVDDGGLATTLRAGSTTISVTDFENQTLSLVITVNNPAVTLDRQSAVLAPGEFFILTASGGDQVYQWTSSDVNVASVDGSGQVFANASGLATITVTDGLGVSASMQVEVRQINLSGPTTLTVGDPAVQLTSSGGIVPFTWTVSNPIFASIDANGLLTANAPGTITVTATDNDGFFGTLDVVISAVPVPAPVPAPAPAPAPAPTPTPTPAPAPTPTGGHGH